jgi:large conductance mechanosensitive channel
MLQPTSLWQEFKTFAFKGNMIDLAVGVVIGAAFTGVINALVKSVLMPAISYVAPNVDSYRSITWGRVEIGIFIAELVNFVLVALAIFVVIVKIVQGTMKRATPAPGAAEPTTKECPYCLSTIPLKASRCAHCTSDVAATAAAV